MWMLDFVSVAEGRIWIDGFLRKRAEMHIWS
jgi:hypothetical protein